MSALRLPQGGHIDRTQPLDFSWQGKFYGGYVGDTLASALLANDIRIVGRSFKYHRPRGIMSAGVEESGALISVGQGARVDANVRATTQELYQGLSARGQNAWPSVRFDVGSVNGLFGRFFAAGFYYKTFMGLPPLEWGQGTRAWMWYERLIRRAAGMGTASREADPDQYEHAHAFCDVLVVGSGPAGIAAALNAAAAGLQVWLVEQDSAIGGGYLSNNDPQVVDEFRLQREALAQSGVTVMTRTTVFGLYDNSVAGLLERVTDHLAAPSSYLPRQRFWTLRAQHTVLATGAIERNLVFGNNDRPGVMTAAAAQTYLHRFGVLAGQKIVLSTNNDSAYGVAADLARAGAGVRLLDARESLANTAAQQSALNAGVTVSLRAAPVNVHGRGQINAVTTAALAGSSWRSQSRTPCDLLLVSGGWSPVVNLLSHRGIKPVWDEQRQAFLPPADFLALSSQRQVSAGQALTVAGSAAGIWEHAACTESGRVAGQVAGQVASAGGAAASSVAGSSVADHTPAQQTGSTAPDSHTRSDQNSADGDWRNPILPLFEVRLPGTHLKSFIDPQHDVTAEDVRLAHREGFVSVEHLKRYTTLGMATDQGKVGNVLGIALMADALGCDIPAVGTTTFRPPYTPVSIGALRGRHVGAHFRPLRRTPLHDWNLTHGATMIDAGLWQRPWYFAATGETISDAYIREAATTRRTVGVCDVTSLGKIAIQGPDAATFLNRIYCNAFAKLPVGKARYGIMLRDDGMVMDDGTTWRLGEFDYFMTTTTAHAARVMVWLEELLQCRWPDLRVHVTSVSEQWAGIAVAGPLSREVLEGVVLDASVTNEAIPFMGVVETRLKSGVMGRIARISFSGELAYEIYVPADFAPALMDGVWGIVQSLNGCLYGLEALGALRIEKGHLTGAELDGNVTLQDAGLGRMGSTTKAYIGSALQQRKELQGTDRPQLVGLFPVDRSQTFNAGSLLFAQGIETGHGEGWITGVTYSPALGHWIGLAFISGGCDRWQDRDVVAVDPVREGRTEVEVVSPHMYDPTGERLHG